MDLLWAPWRLSSLRTSVAPRVLSPVWVPAHWAHSPLHSGISTHGAESREALARHKGTATFNLKTRTFLGRLRGD